MDYTITYFSDAVQEDILALPDTLAARYVVLSRRIPKHLVKVCLSCGSKVLKALHASFSARLLENASLCCTALLKSLTVPRYVSERSPKPE